MQVKLVLGLTASIRIWRSASAIWWPNLCKPTRNSSMLIFPLLLVSIFSNPSFIPATSSTDKCSAITCCTESQRVRFNIERNDDDDDADIRKPKKYNWLVVINYLSTRRITLRALFFSLFITENCLSLALTVSPKETLGAFFTFCNHGWSAFMINTQNSQANAFTFYHPTTAWFRGKVNMFKAKTLLSTPCAVSRRFGSGSSIFRTRSFALSETLGQGSLLKSITDRIIACATPCSVSAQRW